MGDGDRYVSDFSGVYNKHTGSYEKDTTKEDTKAKIPTYRHAQKNAMEHGDSGTYFMRKAEKPRTKRAARKRG
jgi:hypothetical protein